MRRTSQLGGKGWKVNGQQFEEWRSETAAEDSEKSSCPGEGRVMTIALSRNYLEPSAGAAPCLDVIAIPKSRNTTFTIEIACREK